MKAEGGLILRHSYKSHVKSDICVLSRFLPLAASRRPVPQGLCLWHRWCQLPDRQPLLCWSHVHDWSPTSRCTWCCRQMQISWYKGRLLFIYFIYIHLFLTAFCNTGFKMYFEISHQMVKCHVCCYRSLWSLEIIQSQPKPLPRV